MFSLSQSARVVFWRNLIARRRSSRLTVRELCERAGVSPASFFHWQQRLRAADSAQASAAAATVLPVRIVEDRLAEITVELPLGVRVPLGRDCDLILGGGAAVAAKTGLLSKLGVFLTKIWKPLALAAAALFAWFKRNLFFANNPSAP